MKNFGFVKVAAGIPFGKIADIEFNLKEIIKLISEANRNNARIIVFPELTITSYTCNDLFHQKTLIEKSLNGLLEIADKTKTFPILSIVGLPVINCNKLFNCAAVINKGKILGIIPKSFIPNYREFYETRWFYGVEAKFNKSVFINNEEIPFGDDILFIDKENKNLIVGIEICEDLWTAIPPSSYQAIAGATVLCNLSASNILVGKSEYRKDLIKNQSARCIASYIYSSSGPGESTTDVVFDADAAISENGVVLSESERFLRKSQLILADIDLEKIVNERIKQNIGVNNKIFNFISFESNNKTILVNRKFSKHPFIPENKKDLDARCREIFNIQSAGLAKRFESLNFNTKAVIGISGGLDSTLALLVAIKAFNLLEKNIKDIIAITMPGFGTSDRTYNNAVKLAKELKVNLEEIDIKDISELILKKINQRKDQHDVVYENIQARARTYILMTKANRYNGLVLGTGDLSEIALGWSTYNADHISMYNVNSSVPKTLVKFLINWVKENESKDKVKKILNEILEQPISPELLPGINGEIIQKTEEKIGPYELHDFFLYYFVRYGFNYEKILFLANCTFNDKYEKKIIEKWLKLFLIRFFSNQWKRDCIPAGPKVGSIDLSPRGSWRMPADASIESFLK